MATIPISEIVNVIPGVLSAGGNTGSMGALVLSKAVALTAGTPSVFYTAAAVATFFGAESDEAKIAAIYFAGFNGSTQIPDKITFFQAVSGEIVAPA